MNARHVIQVCVFAAIGELGWREWRRGAVFRRRKRLQSLDFARARCLLPTVAMSGSRLRDGLLGRVTAELSARHYSPKTIESYTMWVRRFAAFHRGRHPAVMGAVEISAFLSALASEKNVSAATQNQPLAAVLFLYEKVLRCTVEGPTRFVRARGPKRLPVVLTRQEVRLILDRLTGASALMASLLYGAGLRLLECVSRRVKDIDFSTSQVTVRQGKGRIDGVTIFPRSLHEPFFDHLRFVRRQHASDLAAGAGFVALPYALRAKYPRAAREWIWQWVFPATRTYVHPETGEVRRHHLHETVLQRAVKQAVLAADLSKMASCHSFRHAFATHLLEAGYDIRAVQITRPSRRAYDDDLHALLNRGPLGVKSPLD